MVESRIVNLTGHRCLEPLWNEADVKAEVKAEATEGIAFLWFRQMWAIKLLAVAIQKRNRPLYITETKDTTSIRPLTTGPPDNSSPTNEFRQLVPYAKNRHLIPKYT